jgi:hypothetical protein
MKSGKIVTTIKTVLCFVALMVIIVACDNQPGMMHGNGGSSYMGNWNWIQILVGIILGFLLGYLFARRKK